jgi:hypothetical protein
LIGAVVLILLQLLFFANAAARAALRDLLLKASFSAFSYNLHDLFFRQAKFHSRDVERRSVGDGGFNIKRLAILFLDQDPALLGHSI